MVSILVHHSDPSYGFAERFTFDFLGRPYATVYLLAAGLAHVMPLAAAMRMVVALCTIAPLLGAHALLAVTRRSRAWALLAVPFAFGSLWHWGFLNFLLGTGMLLASLALVVLASQRPSLRRSLALGAASLVLLFTHFHGLAMLLLYAPAFAWTFRAPGGGVRAVARSLIALVPAATAGAAFVLTTWAQAEGNWAQMSPGLGERVLRFGEFLGAGLPAPWPAVWLSALALALAGGLVISGRAGGARLSRPHLVTFAVALAIQVLLYFTLPLNTNTATYVSARHALLCVLFALPLLPDVRGRYRTSVRLAAGALCTLALVVSARHLACFDREARDFDTALAQVKPNRRMAPLIFDRGSRCCDGNGFPYLHFAAYAQAERGGDLSRSFALVWNVPIRYRADYRRYPISEEIEWAPQLFSPADLSHFDYLLLRSQSVRRVPFAPALLEVAHRGEWTLLENPDALPAELPARDYR
jgi:hypothetical protein